MSENMWVLVVCASGTFYLFTGVFICSVVEHYVQDQWTANMLAGIIVYFWPLFLVLLMLAGIWCLLEGSSNFLRRPR